MATFNKFQQFIEDIHHGVHDLETDQLVVALTAASPVATNSVLANLTEISYTNLSSRNITTTSSGQTTGTYRLILVDLVLTASGTVPTFRYVTIYNTTPVSPLDPLIGWYDNGSNVDLTTGQQFTIDFSAVNGLFSNT